jgi:hypothetical protein
MKKSLSVSLALALCTALVAQSPPTKVTITTATAGGFGVLAQTGDSTPKTDSKGIADKTEIKTGQSLRVSTDTSNASTSVGPYARWWHGNGAYLSDHAMANNRDGKLGGSAGSAIGDEKSAKFGPHSVLVAFDLPENEEATLVAYFSGYVNDTATAKGAVDVNNDGKEVWSQEAKSKMYSSVKQTFTVKGGKTPLLVKLTTETNAKQDNNTQGRSHCAAKLTIYLTRKKRSVKCTATNYVTGSECPGKLSYSSSTSGSSRWIRLDLTGAAKDAVGYFVVGAKQNTTGVALPGTTCKLHTDVLALIPFRTSSTGTSTQYLRGSAALTGKVTCQDVVIELSSSGLKISTSNPLEVSCTLQ